MSHPAVRLFQHRDLSWTPPRWAVAAASVLMQAALGSVYASSVFLTSVMERYGASERGADATFALTILALGITAGFGGTLQRRFGPRFVATLGGLLYGSAVCLAAFASTLPLFYLTQGVMGGVGLGLGYIVPLAMLIGWFPDKRGLITGLAVAGFGAGAVLVGPLAAALLNSAGLRSTLLLLGLTYLVLCVGASQFFRAAPQGYAPPGWTPGAPLRAAASAGDHSLREALRRPRWYLLWLILALNVTAGAALISVASPLAQKFAGVSAANAAIAVMVVSVFNGAGRVFWGWISDMIGRPACFISLFALQFLAFALLARTSNFTSLLALCGLIGLCFGGGFAVMPAFVADFFGAKHAGAIYGAMLTAWSAGAAAGPLLVASIDYRAAADIIALIMLAGLPLTVCASLKGAALARALAALFVPDGLPQRARDS